MALLGKLSRPLFLPPVLHNRQVQNALFIASCLILMLFFLYTLTEPEATKPQHTEPEPTEPEPTQLLPYQVYPETNDSIRHTVTEFLPASVHLGTDAAQKLCDSFPKHVLSRIQPVLKIGHGDNKEKLSAQMDSTSACFTPDELIIFSDLDEKIRDHHAIDILAHLPSSHYNATVFKMWEEYLTQKEMQANGILDTDAQVKHINGWALDKFKFLPMMERAWAMKPNKDFYVFYETDTYIFWDNLFQFLQTYDPDANVYIGSPSPGRRDPKRGNQGTLFANGGPGYVISRGAMKALLQRTTGQYGQYIDDPLSTRFSYLNHDDECCGDSVLGWVLWELGIPMNGHWPMFSDYGLHDIPFNDQHWCQPLISLHKTSPKDMLELFSWESSHRKSQRPLLYSDVWEIHKPGTVASRENWDGGRFDTFDPPPETIIESSEQCSRACSEDSGCLQWKWEGRDRKKCVLLRSLQHGRARKAEKEDRGAQDKDKNTWVDYTSGWVKEHVAEWRKKQECNSIVQWVGASVQRKFEN